MTKPSAKTKRQVRGTYLNRKEDGAIDSFLRPAAWRDYIGQEKIKRNLKIILDAARKRREAADHLLFYGQPGLGKTTLAYLVAKEMNANLKVVSAPAIEKTGDLAAILSNLENNEVLFIDEAHRLPRFVEETLYPAMESRKIHVVIGKGLAAQTISLDLPPFTLIAATTRLNLLSNPLRSRFGAAFRIDYYETDDIKTIIRRSAGLMGIKIEEKAISVLADSSRFTPRTANRLLKRTRDFAEVNNLETINEDTARQTLTLWEIDNLGLESQERRLLGIIIKKFNNRAVGVNSLAAAMADDKNTIEEVYEPYLIRLGLLERTPGGRKATETAYKHLKLLAASQ